MNHVDVPCRIITPLEECYTLREVIEQDNVKVEKIQTEDNATDVLTKVLLVTKPSGAVDACTTSCIFFNYKCNLMKTGEVNEQSKG